MEIKKENVSVCSAAKIEKNKMLISAINLDCSPCQNNQVNNRVHQIGCINCLVTDILQNIIFCVQQKKEIHTGLKQLELDKLRQTRMRK